jgi:dipeptidyl aminopeptidase/acylaminoacyl peptidase
MPSAPPRFIPRRLLFDNPERRDLLVSPDGAWLSWLQPDDASVLNVFVAPRNDLASARRLTRDALRGVPAHEWAMTSRHVLHVQDVGGDENWCVLSTEVASGVQRALTPEQGVRAQLVGVSPRYPTRVLVAHNARDPEVLDVHVVDLESGESALEARNDLGFIGFVADAELRVRLAARVTPDGGHEWLLRHDADRWEPFLLLDPEDADTTHPFGISDDGRTLFLADARGRDTAALVAQDLVTGELRVLAEDPGCDVSEALLHPVRGVPQAAIFERLRRRHVVIDTAVAETLGRLAADLRGDVDVVARTLDDATWAVLERRDDAPARFHLHDRATGVTTLAFTSRPKLDEHVLAPMTPVTIRSRDGLEMVSYLSLPPGETLPPRHALPALLFVHGGPWARDRWGFEPHHQLFANRGMAVLSVNYRGSTGFGKRFLNAGDGEWGARMHDDLVDAVGWLVGEGIADPARIAIMGGSYGGYATLVGLTRTPDLFACGIDVVGVSNLLTFMASIPPYWRPILRSLVRRLADPSTPDGHRFLVERSPLSHVDRIRRPLLIAQGANDPRVKKAESDQIVEAMKRRGIPVTYCLFPDEGHGFRRPENSLAFIAVAEAFLAQRLGTGAPPLRGDDLAGSSLEVPEGAAGIPGLAEALRERGPGP